MTSSAGRNQYSTAQPRELHRAGEWQGSESARPDWTDQHVCVAGLGISGASAARALLELGARVTVVDGGAGDRLREQAADLQRAGASVVIGQPPVLPKGATSVVTSPGWRPNQPLFTAAADAGIEVYGDVELAWRLREQAVAKGRRPTPWLAVTGTNGKTTTVRMLAAILTAAGYLTAAVGNVGTPILDVVRSGARYDVLALELSSFQLHWAPSLRAHSAAVLNLAADHLDWHGSMAAYAADKGRIYQGNRVACVYNRADPATEELVRGADVEDGCRAIGFTLASPGPAELGIVDGIMVDRAFSGPVRNGSAFPGELPPPPQPSGAAEELAQVTDIASAADYHDDRGTSAPAPAAGEPSVADRPGHQRAAAGPAPHHPAPHNPAPHHPAPHNVANALAAAALARAFGVPASAVRDGLRDFRPDAHRMAHVATIADVTYVNDSKATNPHAAAASLTAFDRSVWIAGGLAKGASFDELVLAAKDGLRAVVLLGRDRAVIHQALTRYAPQVPVVDLDRTDPETMVAAVAVAARLAQPGDTVLLAPACASMDMFTNYGRRGEAFTDAVAKLAARSGEPAGPIAH